MLSSKRAYLIVPKLIEQPTWGGNYILKLKNWSQTLKNKKIGQSYELFGLSKLHLKAINSSDPSFVPEFGYADKDDLALDSIRYKEEIECKTLQNFVIQNPLEVLGKNVWEKFKKMPLLNKINHAFGNSFQLHIKQGVDHTQWKPKPESWYYLEDGLISFGIKKNCDVAAYKKACFAIDAHMNELSQKIKSGSITLEDGKKEALSYIKTVNPWQYINTYRVKKYDLIDLSLGGLHHSWEEDKKALPLGNVLYEVQQDVMDPISTIRSFDQGKFKDDGTVRKLAIEDYFQFLDTDPSHNELDNMRQVRKGNRLLTTPYYCLDMLEITDSLTQNTENSFVHLFVREGTIAIKTAETILTLTPGHSCFVPQNVGSYTIHSTTNAVVLKTFIE